MAFHKALRLWSAATCRRFGFANNLPMSPIPPRKAATGRRTPKNFRVVGIFEPRPGTVKTSRLHSECQRREHGLNLKQRKKSC